MIDINDFLTKEARNARRWVLRKNNGKSYGMCADASEKLLNRILRVFPDVSFDDAFICGEFYVLRDGDFVSAGYHYWVEWNNTIIDVTADQFSWSQDFPAIIIGKELYGRFKDHYRDEEGEKIYG